MPALRIAAFIAGAAVALATLLSAVRVFLLTRATPSIFARIVSRMVRRVLHLFAGERRPFEARDRVLAYYAPLSLAMLLGTWILVLASRSVRCSGHLTGGLSRPP